MTSKAERRTLSAAEVDEYVTAACKALDVAMRSGKHELALKAADAASAVMRGREIPISIDIDVAALCSAVGMARTIDDALSAGLSLESAKMVAASVISTRALTFAQESGILGTVLAQNGFADDGTAIGGES